MVDSTGGIIIDPQGLRRIAGTVDTTVGTLDGAYQPRQATLAPALGAWATGDAAVTATRSWGVFMARLRTGVAGVADGMRAAAADYTATDANAARLLEKAR